MEDELLDETIGSVSSSFLGLDLMSLIEKFAIFLIIILVVVLILYILIAIFLNKYNKLVNGKGTPLAWIPLCNVYLLGKLTINKLVGWILVIVPFLTGTYTTTINGVETSRTILPGRISQILSIVHSVTVFILLIYAIVQYNQLKKSQEITANENIDNNQNQEAVVTVQNNQDMVNSINQQNNLMEQNQMNNVNQNINIPQPVIQNNSNMNSQNIFNSGNNLDNISNNLNQQNVNQAPNNQDINNTNL